MEVENLLKQYFHLGLKNKEIMQCMRMLHGHIISERTLKRMKRKLGLFRRKEMTDLLEVALYIAGQCDGPSQNQGYRWMHSKCIQHGFTVTQENVRLILQVIDPEGVDYRKRRRLKRRKYINPGPNATWHINGYDKLAKYGIYIHGCVDGFSRRIIWLHAYYTNKDSRVISGYFMDTVSKSSICPRRIRADRGTENVHVEELQKYLRRNHTDEHAGNKSFLYGASVNNQRIEWMWGLVPRQGMQYWISSFQNMAEEDIFNGDYLDLNLVRFCFTDLVQNTLDDIMKLWNCHKICSYRNQILTSGRPWMLHCMPHLSCTHDYAMTVEEEDIEESMELVHEKTDMPCCPLVFHICLRTIEQYHLPVPEEPDEMYELYIFLRNTIKRDLL